MTRWTDPFRPRVRLLPTALLPLLLLSVWCLHDSQAYVQRVTDNGSGMFWAKSWATLHLNLGSSSWNNAAKKAMAQWNATGSGFTFHLPRQHRQVGPSCGGQDKINTVVWAPTQCGLTFGGTTLAVARTLFDPQTGEIHDVDVIFNNTQQWSIYSGPLRWGVMDFGRVALHEFGHVLGLDHPDEHGQFLPVRPIMNSTATHIDRLQPDDINGVRAIYGSGSGGGGGGYNGHADYCRDHGPCSAGQGDCDGNSECRSGLTCREDVGAKYGFHPSTDVCEVPSRGDNGHVDYCRDYGPCSAGQGDCEPGQCADGLVCANDVGARYGMPADYDVCEAPSNGHRDYCKNSYYGPCNAGQGDCDRDKECQVGLTCREDVGAKYGFHPSTDVCEAPSRGENGHPDYCRDYGPCSAGQGDCDPGQCAAGLVCANDVGAGYWMPAHYDVCQALGGGYNGHPDYCRDYGPCSAGQGDCDPGQCAAGLVCTNDVGANYGMPAHYDVCEARSGGRNGHADYCRDYGPCSAGQGDCDPGQCAAGLVCANDVGANYGMPADYDVCEAPSGSVTNSIGMELVLIPAGTFQMGAPALEQGSSDEERPVHQVTISQGFYLGKYEVTQAQWQAVMGTNPSRHSCNNCPVDRVSWDDVQRFIEALNRKEGVTTYRLPSEAEWEYAARAGTQTVYSFGSDANQLGQYAWYADNNYDNWFRPVGGKQPNAFGLYDMHGNVEEWVQDCGILNYTGAPTDGSAWVTGNCASRIMRGGNTWDRAKRLRSASRNRMEADNRTNVVGFRLARSVD